MSPATRWIFNSLKIALSLQLTACALFEERTGPPIYFGPREQVYYASFEEVWRSVNIALQPYPLRISNMDQGLLETDNIRGYKVWSPPYKSDMVSGGQYYHLTIRVVRGNLQKKQATKVTIVKDVEVQPDFFSDPKNLGSDGLEEKTLLYRIGREIQMDRAMSKAQKKNNQTQ